MIKTETSVWVASIIEKSGLTLMEFSKKYGFKYRTIQELRLGNRKPSSPSVALLKRIEEEIDGTKV